MPTNEYKETDDVGLMSLACSGREEAFGELVTRYQSSLYRLCLYYMREVETARDLAQDAFLRAFQARDSFDTSHDFKPWLFRIGRNLCLNEIKRRKIVPMLSLEDLMYPKAGGQARPYDPPDDGLIPSAQAEKNERLGTLKKALDTMDEFSRELIYMRYFNRMSAKEIGEVIDSNEGAVRTRIHRALKRLQEITLSSEES